jgi:hypothetical protein
MSEKNDPKKRRRLPYNADVRNAMLGIRRGQPIRMVRGKLRATAEHPSEVVQVRERE